MTSQGSASGRFTRAIKQRNLFQAEIAAREMRGLSLADSSAGKIAHARSFVARRVINVELDENESSRVREALTRLEVDAKARD